MEQGEHGTGGGEVYELSGAALRDPERAVAVAARGVRVRRGDFTESDSLTHAFEGATQVLIISGRETGGPAVAQHAAAIDAARAAGAERILYTSHQAASAASLFALIPDHAATERYLAGTGTPFTALRNGFYASTVPFLLGRAQETGELVAQRRWARVVDHARRPRRSGSDHPRGRRPVRRCDSPLTARDALDLEDITGILTELTGRTIRRVVDDEWTAGLIGLGVPTEQANMMLGMFHASRRGEFATTGAALEDLLGRAATPVRSILEEVATPR